MKDCSVLQPFNMSHFTPEVLTSLLNVKFLDAFPPHNVTYMTPSSQALIIQIRGAWPNDYGREQTNFGRSIRLLWLLEEKKNLSSVLKDFDITTVFVTSAPEPELCNIDNTTQFKFEFLKEALGGMRTLKAFGKDTLEGGIKTLIAENKNNHLKR